MAEAREQVAPRAHYHKKCAALTVTFHAQSIATQGDAFERSPSSAMSHMPSFHKSDGDDGRCTVARERTGSHGAMCCLPQLSFPALFTLSNAASSGLSGSTVISDAYQLFVSLVALCSYGKVLTTHELQHFLPQWHWQSNTIFEQKRART